MEALPDILFVIDIKRETGALHEASMKGIEVVAIVDSNCDPTLVDYPIPMNDDATRAVEYVLDLVRDAILEGKKKVKGSKSRTSSTGRKGKTDKN
jgi:small subunit ribosomal protein S2